MITFITTNRIVLELEELIKEENVELTLVTPFLKINRIILDHLIEKSEQGVRVNIIYGKKKLTNEEAEKILKIKNLNLYFLPNLHSKCYFGTNVMILTSMNLYEYSELKNREMGILIKDHEQIYEDIVDETRSIIKASEVKVSKGGEPSYLESGIEEARKYFSEKYRIQNCSIKKHDNSWGSGGKYLEIVDSPLRNFTTTLDYRLSITWNGSLKEMERIYPQFKSENLEDGEYRVYWNHPTGSIYIYMKKDLDWDILNIQERVTYWDNGIEFVKSILKKLL
ncbi:MAG: phospholipase D-like domain-containing protein [Balneolaceae bacterium]